MVTIRISGNDVPIPALVGRLIRVLGSGIHVAIRASVPDVVRVDAIRLARWTKAATSVHWTV